MMKKMLILCVVSLVLAGCVSKNNGPKNSVTLLGTYTNTGSGTVLGGLGSFVITSESITITCPANYYLPTVEYNNPPIFGGNDIDIYYVGPTDLTYYKIEVDYSSNPPVDGNSHSTTDSYGDDTNYYNSRNGGNYTKILCVPYDAINSWSLTSPV